MQELHTLKSDKTYATLLNDPNYFSSQGTCISTKLIRHKVMLLSLQTPENENFLTGRGPFKIPQQITMHHNLQNIEEILDIEQLESSTQKGWVRNWFDLI